MADPTLPGEEQARGFLKRNETYLISLSTIIGVLIAFANSQMSMVAALLAIAGATGLITLRRDAKADAEAIEAKTEAVNDQVDAKLATLVAIAGKTNSGV
ncbi:hypothetical protein WJS89_10500 [Sphingomicrobium sp. XHP0235]|uniref:hypothetical protein n=1 Tax=Sphingomicrobium aquimarinum TaxID=3133971 RepID=UPI0031FEB9BC